MHASDLLPVLNGSVSGSVLRGKISKEVAEYFLLIQKKGANISLHFNEDIEIILSQKSILTLLTEILYGNLTSVDLAYICDCLTLGEKVFFVDEQTKDLIFDLADPEINGGFRKTEEIQQLLENLNSKS